MQFTIMKKFIFFSLFIGIQLIGMQKQLALKHRKRKREELYYGLPSSLSVKPLVQLTALAEQADHFSCGYRTLFHAQCIDIAIEQATQGKSFGQSLKDLFGNTEMLQDVYIKVKSYLDIHHKTYDKHAGLQINHILGICKEQIPSLKNNLLPALLESDGTIYTVREPDTQTPMHYSSEFVLHYGSSKFSHNNCKIKLDQSVELQTHIKKLEDPLQTAHFLCRFPNHFFLASIITDQNSDAILFVVDSNNNGIENHFKIRTIVSQLLPYVETINNRAKKRNNSG